MAVEVPSFDELMRPALQALKAMGGSATNEELLQKVVEIGGYPPRYRTLSTQIIGRPSSITISRGRRRT